MKSRDVIIRREMRLLPLRSAWQRAFPLCLFLSVLIVLESFVETYLILFLTAQPMIAISGFIDMAWITVCLMLPAIIVGNRLKSDLRTKTLEQFLATEMSVRDYLEGILIAAFRSSLVIIWALIARHIMLRLATDRSLAEYASLEMLNLVVMVLATSAITLFIEALIIWCSGMLCYASMTMALVLRGWSIRAALVPSLAVALVLDVFLGHWLAGLGLRLSSILIATLTVLPITFAVVKWMIHRWLFDKCVERFSEWTEG